MKRSAGTCCSCCVYLFIHSFLFLLFLFFLIFPSVSFVSFPQCLRVHVVKLLRGQNNCFDFFVSFRFYYNSQINITTNLSAGFFPLINMHFCRSIPLRSFSLYKPKTPSHHQRRSRSFYMRLLVSIQNRFQ